MPDYVGPGRVVTIVVIPGSCYNATVWTGEPPEQPFGVWMVVTGLMTIIGFAMIVIGYRIAFKPVNAQPGA